MQPHHLFELTLVAAREIKKKPNKPTITDESALHIFIMSACQIFHALQACKTRSNDMVDPLFNRIHAKLRCPKTVLSIIKVVTSTDYLRPFLWFVIDLYLRWNKLCNWQAPKSWNYLSKGDWLFWHNMTFKAKPNT